MAWREFAVPLIFCTLFIAVAVPWIDKPGIQTDEALFAAGIYPPFDSRYCVRIFGHDYPLMTMTYVGALKSRVWAMIFHLCPPSPASVRIPAILLGAFSVWLMYRLLAATHGRGAALAGSALVATDPVYILYSRYDHGPVVIHHLCLLGAMLALVRFQQQRRTLWLVLAFFLLGLGMWEKAVFAWLIGGLTVAGLVTFWPELRAAATLRNIVVAGVSFAAGASPLLIYNARNGLVTFRSNTQWSTEGLDPKVAVLKATLQGDALFGAMMRENWEEPVREPETAGQRAVVAISQASGNRRRHLLGYLAAAALLCLPFVWRTAGRTFLFASIFLVVAWLQMAFTRNAGGGAHHTILLWPVPHIAIAAILAASSRRIRFGRALLSGAVTLVCIASLLVLSTYYTNLLRNGGTASWTDAMYPAFDAIAAMDKEAVCIVDWGFFDTLRMMHQGRTALCAFSDPVDEQSRHFARLQISNPRNIFLTHTHGQESLPGITERLMRFAEQEGFHRKDHRVFTDSNGRETVELFRFER